MHEGEVDTHHEPGTEIWVFDVDARRRIYRIELETPVNSLMVTQEDEPKLIIADDKYSTHVYDALTLVHERTIQTPSASMFEDF